MHCQLEQVKNFYDEFSQIANISLVEFKPKALDFYLKNLSIEERYYLSLVMGNFDNYRFSCSYFMGFATGAFIAIFFGNYLSS